MRSTYHDCYKRDTNRRYACGRYSPQVDGPRAHPTTTGIQPKSHSKIHVRSRDEEPCYRTKPHTPSGGAETKENARHHLKNPPATPQTHSNTQVKQATNQPTNQPIQNRSSTPNPSQYLRHLPEPPASATPEHMDG